jgi:hypothetical protein
MRLQVFSVYDKAVGAYLQPFFSRSKGEALRSFTSACNEDKHQFNVHSSDYVLFDIGEFDDASGLFSPREPSRIISAIECVAEIPFDAGPGVTPFTKR